MKQEELKKLKPGAKVRFTSEMAHLANPAFFPVVGTVGEISSVLKDAGAWVKWDDGVKCKGVWHSAASWLESASESTRPTKILITVDKADPKKVIAKDLDSGVVGVAKCSPADTFDFYTGAKLAFARLCGEDQPKHKCKFKVGDKIVGNKLANRYNITKEGWKGVVVKVLDNPKRGNGCDDGKDWTFAARGVDDSCEIYLAEDAFDLLPKPKGWNGKVVCVSNGKCEYWCSDFTIGKVYTVKDGKLDCDHHNKKYPVNRFGEEKQFEKFEDIRRYDGLLSKFIEYKGEA